MAADINVALYRFPHLENIIDEPTTLSDGSVLKVDETITSLGLVKSLGYDVWELPLVRYIAAREAGHEISALPVFTARRFIQWMFEVPEHSDIQVVKDLEGKRIVQSYIGNTDMIWAKGLIEETYDVDLSGITWYTLHGELVEGTFTPEGVVNLDRPHDRDELMLTGVVDAAVTSGHPNPVRPGLRSLWADPETEIATWYKSWPVFPILHVVVVRNSALAGHESLGRDLFQLFETAKNDALARWDYGTTLPEEKRNQALWSGFPGSAWNGADRAFLGRDPLPYGVEANRDELEQIMRYAVRQQAIKRVHPLEELFPLVL
jgi:4,5-dihydroxyphthalate decarboxylase